MEIKERPILFNADMVRAILDGRKTQTRRIVKDICFVGGRGDENNPKYWESTRWGSQTDCEEGLSLADFLKFPVTCPFGAPGDRLWVRETFAARVNHACGQDACDCGDVTITYAADNEERFFNDDSSMGDFCINGRKMIPSIHMPRWASRITLEIKSVRVERLQDISEEDAKAEGVRPITESEFCLDRHRTVFESLWSGMYGEESWKQNPWVWVIEFEGIK